MAGIIYILTNPSFPKYIKIGYADNLERRLAQLNRSECIPFAFRVYATYEVDSRLSDQKIHNIIDTLNPNLRSIESFNGRTRIREFYAMAPEEAYSILQSIAEMHGYADWLMLHNPTEDETQAEEIAQEIETEVVERASAFSFAKCNIPIGSKIQYGRNPEIEAEVVDDKRVKYDGVTMSLTALAKMLTGTSRELAGPKFFKYNGEWLNDIRRRLGV